MSTRRGFLSTSSQLTEAALMILLTKRDQNLIKKPATSLEIASSAVNLEAQWGTLPPAQRLDLLERQNAPVSLDVRKEIATAVAEIICGQMRCKVTPAEMVEGLTFLPSQEFLTQLERTMGAPLQKDQIGRELTQRLEFKGDNKHVYVNNPLWERINLTLPSDIRAALVGRNTAMVVGKSLDFHAFTHLVESEEEFNFPPFSFIAHGLEVPEVGKMIGLKFVGKEADGTTIYLTGAHEASTELVASIMANRKAPPYANLAYKEGAQLLAEVHRAARISDDEFLKVKDGSLNTQWYLTKIASIQNPRNPDIKKAQLALVSIAFGQAGLTTWSDARRGVIDWLSPDAPQIAVPTSVIRLPSR